MQPKRSAARKRKLQLLPSAVGEAPAFAGRPETESKSWSYRLILPGAKAAAFAYCRRQKLELSLTTEDLFDFNQRSDRAGLEDLLGFFF
jgi:hypothetical protein